MSQEHSITRWLRRLSDDEEHALLRLYQRVAPELAAIARRRLGDRPIRLADESDIVNEAFLDFHRRVKSGAAMWLESRHDFFALLACIIGCRSKNLLHKTRRERIVLNEAGPDAVSEGRQGLAELAADVASPSRSLEVEESLRQCLEILPAEWRTLAAMHLAGASQEEMKRATGLALRTVQRRLDNIRTCWRDAGERMMDAVMTI
jgi:DNA-directed RNA polymerase specialized sigma24 family protein